jgi:hypothetical protein
MCRARRSVLPTKGGKHDKWEENSLMSTVLQKVAVQIGLFCTGKTVFNIIIIIIIT